MVLEERAARLEAEVIQKKKEDKGADTLLGAAYRALLNISQISQLTVRANPLWPTL